MNQAIDNLTYFYDSGNKLMRITDNENNIKGFKDGNRSGNDYTYDANDFRGKGFKKVLNEETRMQ